MKGNFSRMKAMKIIRMSEATIICCAYLMLVSCQSSSQSSQSSPPMPSSQSQSSSNSQSMPSSQSQRSSNSQSMPSSQSQSSASSRSMPSSSSQSTVAGQSRSNTSSSASSEQSSSQPDRQGNESRAAVDGSPPINATSGQGTQSSGNTLPVGSVISAREGGSIRGGQPGFEQIGSPGDRDISTGDISEQSGKKGSNIPPRSGKSGDYTLENLPNRGISGDSQLETGGPMTAAERARVLDERLRKGYETFDGFILSEREKAQNESNAAGSAQPGADGGGGGSSQYQPQIVQETSGDPSAVAGSPPSPTAGRETAETFPAPDDIPSGRDDDVVARQLREAAMSEPDPALREALWDEYRNYTGIDGYTNQ